MKLNEFFEGVWDDEQKRPQQNGCGLHNVDHTLESLLMFEVVWQQLASLPSLLAELVSRLAGLDGETRETACVAFRSAIDNLPSYFDTTQTLQSYMSIIAAYLLRIYNEICSSHE